jgi:carbon starvation protein CstA
MAGTVWLIKEEKKYASLVTLLPGMFMTMVVFTFILWTPGKNGMPTGIIPGGIPMVASVVISMFMSSLFAFWVVRRGCSLCTSK